MSAPGIDLASLDLSACDREPIHIPGSIQPHGYLFCLHPETGRILQISTNAAGLFGCSLAEMLGKPISDYLGTSLDETLTALRVERPRQPRLLVRVRAGGERIEFIAAAHVSDAGIILELEKLAADQDNEFADPYRPLEAFLAERLGGLRQIALCDLAAHLIRSITGFDRVLVYRFDAEWNGTVIAESRNDRLPSYLNLSFPASDIPRQARELYRQNRIRLIADAQYTPVPIEPALNPLTSQPLDLGFAALRSVSPVYVQYMKNMGTQSSLSFSILRESELWGLISCHHSEARQVSFQRRSVCDILAQLLSLELAALDRADETNQLVELQTIQTRLLRQMTTKEIFTDALVEAGDDLLALAGAAGAAVLFENRCDLLGTTPSREQVTRIVDWLHHEGAQDLLHTDSLAQIWPEARAWKDSASGLLAISISKIHNSYVLWFRPERVRTITWGGDPRKPVEAADATGRLSPRHSFAAWQESVRERSEPWRASELTVAAEFRNSVVGIVLKRAEELAKLSAELERSNKELEAFSYSVSHDLRAPLRHIAGYAELLGEEGSSTLTHAGRRYLDTIKESVEFAGKLVDNLLHFSRLGRNRIKVENVNLDRLVREVAGQLNSENSGRQIRWTIHALPKVYGDVLLLEVVVRNLLSNAIKYTRQREIAEIEVGYERTEREHIIFVRDNGAGFDMQFVDKLFGVFQRLHRMEDFEGTGIGLANVRRIVARLGGRTWAAGAVSKGATFYFSLPIEATSETV